MDAAAGGTDGTLWTAWTVAHVLGALVSHELGHACAAVTVGGRVAALGLGMPRRLRARARVGSVLLYVGRPAWRGMNAWLLPPEGGFGAAGAAWVVAAGPGVNLVMALGLGAAAALDAGHAGMWVLAAVLHALCGVANLLPGLPDESPSDGTQLWALFRARAASARARKADGVSMPLAPGPDAVPGVSPRILHALAVASRRAGCVETPVPLMRQAAEAYAAAGNTRRARACAACAGHWAAAGQRVRVALPHVSAP